MTSNPFAAGADDGPANKELWWRNLALTGGVLLASADTEGHPDLAWRAKSRPKAIGREAEHTKAALSREAAHTKASLTRGGKRAARKAKKVAAKASKAVEGALK